MSEKVRSRLVIASIVAATLVVTGFTILYTQYDTLGWFLEPPPKMHFGGLGYSLTSIPPTTGLPGDVSWTPQRRMLPLWYRVFFPVDRDPTSIYVQWRDGLFYQYGTQD
ncbi:hypothetical protein HQ325_16705 [Rhodococcus sp. BP-349]|uniref:hypothetical protein n=1 Tax=unclassified Rhodococcus (in: high G+C Gram-positive bacteria) TaxID=192944 RepID=UPI001C9BA868|nr:MULTISPECIES: hypothetical protein [unclassified Rhodococcus (in: high G+C Gram-positive bacteria)]MBY6540316.1 hypothetical protein [Rhodococcus sp. BP-363]MBY6545659.1 hypothetical protein [Rhodococcus sp. BP-369]MBY6564889.1 hypothetical protein [Rhodococcus sp. BP-370]MBY6578175.1 hypothetical protein [Rhodococcus sp. BP-364]MBY6587476.1 hypothetical protein [Rhodococcus sp. BP-358]